jgi:Flp pilus assembly pilin Flp
MGVLLTKVSMSNPRQFMAFVRDERAATAIEYGLIITGIALGTLAVLAVVGAKIEAAFLLLTTAV